MRPAEAPNPTSVDSRNTPWCTFTRTQIRTLNPALSIWRSFYKTSELIQQRFVYCSRPSLTQATLLYYLKKKKCLLDVFMSGLNSCSITHNSAKKCCILHSCRPKTREQATLRKTKSFRFQSTLRCQLKRFHFQSFFCLSVSISSLSFRGPFCAN